jgi:hypothetical protein
MNLKKIFGLMLIGLMLVISLVARASNKDSSSSWVTLCSVYLFDENGNEIKHFENRVESIYISTKSVKFDAKKQILKIKGGGWLLASFNNDTRGIILNFENLEIKLFNIHRWKAIEIGLITDDFVKIEVYQYFPKTGEYKLVHVDIDKVEL